MVTKERWWRFHEKKNGAKVRTKKKERDKIFKLAFKRTDVGSQFIFFSCVFDSLETLNKKKNVPKP